MQFADYLVDNNGTGVQGFLQSLGYEFNSKDEVKRCLNHYLSQGDVAPLIHLHPDYELIREADCRPQAQLPAVQVKAEPVAVQTTSPERSQWDMPVLNLSSMMEGVNPSLVNVFFLLGCLYLLIKIIKG